MAMMEKPAFPVDSLLSQTSQTLMNHVTAHSNSWDRSTCDYSFDAHSHRSLCISPTPPDSPPPAPPQISSSPPLLAARTTPWTIPRNRTTLPAPLRPSVPPTDPPKAETPECWPARPALCPPRRLRSCGDRRWAERRRRRRPPCRSSPDSRPRRGCPCPSPRRECPTGWAAGTRSSPRACARDEARRGRGCHVGAKLSGGEIVSDDSCCGVDEGFLGMKRGEEERNEGIEDGSLIHDNDIHA